MRIKKTKLGDNGYLLQLSYQLHEVDFAAKFWEPKAKQSMLLFEGIFHLWSNMDATNDWALTVCHTLCYVFHRYFISSSWKGHEVDSTLEQKWKFWSREIRFFQITELVLFTMGPSCFSSSLSFALIFSPAWVWVHLLSIRIGISSGFGES